MTTIRYTDPRSVKIAVNLGQAVALYADRNLAGWAMDMLADDRVDDDVGTLRVCDRFALRHPHLLGLAR